MMEQIDWQTSFKGLPDIPGCKRWRGDDLPLDHISLFKFLNKEKQTPDDEKIINEAADFYVKLYEQLPSVNYSEFDEQDFKNFKNYILYAYNFQVTGGVGLTVKHTFRMVLNESVTVEKTNTRITHRDQLTFPSLKIVGKYNLFNRANTPNTTVFYSGENIDTAVKECRPPLGRLVTVGCWKTNFNKNPTKKNLVTYQIADSDAAFNHNQGLRDATLQIEQLSGFNLLNARYWRSYMKVLGREFTKSPIKHNNEYYLSAVFSEQIFKTTSPKDNLPYDAIIYPSVGNGYITDNLAIRPSVVENYFYLDYALEFEVEEQYYDKVYIWNIPEIITLAKVKNVHRSAFVDNDTGIIYW